MNMEEIKKALEMKDSGKVAELLYYVADELEDEELEEILKEAEKLAKESKNYELYKLVVYIYQEFLGVDKISEFEAMAFDEDTFDAKFNLADLYALIGEVEKALGLFREILEEETAKGNKENIAKVYYEMALAHEELTEYEKARELMEKAAVVYEALGKEDDYLHALIYLAYLKFENGEVSEAKADIAELLPRIQEKPVLLAQAHLVYEEIFEDEENYDAALQECLYAMIKSGEYFDVAFDALLDVIWQLMLEDRFDVIYENMDMFARAFKDLSEFFNGVKAIALFKDGKMEGKEVKEILAKIKDRRLFDLVQLLGEAEF